MPNELCWSLIAPLFSHYNISNPQILPCSSLAIQLTLSVNLSVAASSSWPQLVSTIKNSCLPKLICELNASPHKEKLTDSEKSLLSLIR